MIIRTLNLMLILLLHPLIDFLKGKGILFKFWSKKKGKSMITSKQRAFLRKEANGIDPIFQIGKGGVTEETITQLSNALEARELIKVHVLETAMLDIKSACNDIAEQLNAEPVQAIGSKFVLYRQARKEKNRVIKLPK